MNTRFKSATDFRKSLEARLQTLAAASGQDLQRLRRKVAFDRFLARIFTQEQPSFYLKGGYAMELRIAQARATKDIDLTCIRRVKNETELLNELILTDLRSLAKQDLNDHFIYQVGEAQIDLENAPYGGARYPVSALIDRKLFVRFQLDVGADYLLDEIEIIQGNNWLEFCSISPPAISMISIEQQFAEKLHAYTLPRGERVNSRAKDLVDMALLIAKKPLQAASMMQTTKTVFQKRGTHSLPSKLEKPPLEWQPQFSTMANECGLSPDMNVTYEKISKYYNNIISTQNDNRSSQ
ncbi:MAG: Nucleotidyl transferase AbiEii/AbiGii toxin family protein [Parachlamydiales bacterium]|nr:Nucleotidyl transferase AbiEii/AbiGii toxin family protein [Parachlamydiales bacterium]